MREKAFKRDSDFSLKAGTTTNMTVFQNLQETRFILHQTQRHGCNAYVGE